MNVDRKEGSIRKKGTSIDQKKRNDVLRVELPADEFRTPFSERAFSFHFTILCFKIPIALFEGSPPPDSKRVSLI